MSFMDLLLRPFFSVLTDVCALSGSLVAVLQEVTERGMGEMLSWATANWVEFKYQCYRLYCAVFGRYNAVVCQSLSPHYRDADELLLHANFQILVDFIEREKPWQYNMPYEQLYSAYMLNMQNHERAVSRAVEWENLTKLYKWWLIRRQRFTTSNDWDTDSKRLIQLVAARGRLWT